MGGTKTHAPRSNMACAALHTHLIACLARAAAARMIDLVRTMVQKVDFPLHEAVAMATQNPARAIGLQTKGQLAIGADADLVVLSPDLRVLRTFAWRRGNSA